MRPEVGDGVLQQAWSERWVLERHKDDKHRTRHPSIPISSVLVLVLLGTVVENWTYEREQIQVSINTV
jgi:hypothetical protein